MKEGMLPVEMLVQMERQEAFASNRRLIPHCVLINDKPMVEYMPNPYFVEGKPQMEDDDCYEKSNAESAAYIAIDALKAGAMYTHEVRRILRNVPAIAAVMDEEPRAVAFGGKPVEPRADRVGGYLNMARDIDAAT